MNLKVSHAINFLTKFLLIKIVSVHLLHVTKWRVILDRQHRDKSLTEGALIETLACQPIKSRGLLAMTLAMLYMPDGPWQSVIHQRQ